MRIISKFHEYYDCIQREGQDRTCIYLREINNRVVNFILPRVEHSWSKYPLEYRTYKYYVGFCGKIYPVIVMIYGSKGFPNYKYFYCYNANDVHEAIYYGKHKKFIKQYEDVDKLFNYVKNYNFNRKGIEQYFSLFPIVNEQLFVDSGCPIFVISSSQVYRKYSLVFNQIEYHGKVKDTVQGLVLNEEERFDPLPTLSNLQFYRVFSPQLAFQEIHMYLSGILGTGNPVIPHVPDKIMIGAKGFDKFSFRKDKK